MSTEACEREFDFALIVGGVPELTDEVLNALFEAGCDDATVTMRYGRLYIEFSRTAATLEDAITSAISDVFKADINAEILRVDECNLATMAEIARKIDRSRQLVHQYINGVRGPGGFPPPECYLNHDKPLWAWCAVSHWLVDNNLLKPEICWHADVVATINNILEMRRFRSRYPEFVESVKQTLAAG